VDDSTGVERKKSNLEGKPIWVAGKQIMGRGNAHRVKQKCLLRNEKIDSGGRSRKMQRKKKDKTRLFATKKTVMGCAELKGII